MPTSAENSRATLTRPMPLRRSALLGLLLLALSATAAPSPEEGRLLSRVFLPEDYRGDTQVGDIAQTPDGLIYAANLGSVKEYDGRAWRSLNVPTGWIRQLAAAPDGRLYFAAFDELGCLEPGLDGQRHFRSLLDRVPAELKPLGRQRDCVVHAGGVYWSIGRRILCWRDGRMDVHNFAEGAAPALQPGGKQLYLVVPGDALYRRDGENWTVVSRDPRVARELPLVVDDWAGAGPLAIDAEGHCWRIGADGTPTAFSTTLTAGDLPGGIVHGLVLRDGRLALATANGGVLLLTTDGAIDGRFGLDGGVGLPVLNRLAQDAEGGLWLATGLGATRVDLDRAVTVFDEKTGVPPGVGLSVFRLDGVLHSCGEDGLYRFVGGEAGRRGHFERVPGPKFYPYGTEDHPTGKLVLTDKGLFRFAHGEFTLEFNTPEPAYVLAASATDPDRVFLGGTGFLRTAKWDGRAWRDEGPVAGFSEDVISAVEDREGSLWLGTPTAGPVRVWRRPGHTDWQTAQFQRYGPERGMPPEHEWVTSYPGGPRPVLSHSRGVSVYDPVADRIVPAPAFAAVGRDGRYVFPLTAQPDGTLWAQVGNPARDEPMELGGAVPQPGGGWKWQPLSSRILASTGFPGAYQLAFDAAGGDEGILWLVSRGTIVRIDLAAERRRAPAAPAHALLRGVWLGEATVSTDGAARLRPGREPLRVAFANPQYELRGAIEYQHRLAGFDDRWSPWSAESEAVFMNLPPGTFAFEVRARAGGGEPGPVARWAFAVLPPWWRTWPAGGAVVLLAAAVVWGLMRWRTAALEGERRRLEALVATRTGELAHERDRADAANRAKTAFLASMSHELRTPLHAILGYSQLLGADTTLPAPARERLQIVGDSGRHLLRLINEVLDLAKIEAGKLELQPAPFELPALLTGLAAAHEPRATAKGLAFRRSEVADLPGAVVGDTAKLRQALENLLGNAIKFTARGEVRLLAFPLGGERVRFEVSDTGPGIAAANLARLFQPFTQFASGGAAPTESGSGLGLAITQRLVALLGGELAVASEVGHGTRFWFELELARPTGAIAAGATPRRIVGYDGPRRRVLAIDDVAANRRLFAELLAPLGFEVVEAGSVADALARLETFRPDLVLLDLRLPDGDGCALARRLRADRRLEGVKILAASASVFNDSPAEALAAGCDGFIAKPFLPEEFLARVGALLGLNWREAESGFVAKAEGASVPLAPELLEPLRAAAEAGDIVALREAFARLRERHGTAPALEPLARAIAAFDTAAVAHLARPPEPPAGGISR